MFHVLSAIAEFERDLIRERVIAGIRRARTQGRHVGRPAKYRRSSASTPGDMRPGKLQQCAQCVTS
jgi:DNA invertase Pin-like site-specific DNA recombinase